VRQTPAHAPRQHVATTGHYAPAIVLHAAYATSLDPQEMRRRAPLAIPQGTGWLTGWRLTFAGEELGWEGAIATVVQDGSPGAGVFVALYDVADADAAGLDAWEGLDLARFRKVRVRVQTMEGHVAAWVYVVDAYEGGLPSARYLGVIADAAEAAGAPADYVADLRARPCQSLGA
jgi:gamma-glutamylcyclotransferase (GGCT)/AIG2-like uncharacterized protein YtfP